MIEVKQMKKKQEKKSAIKKNEVGLGSRVLFWRRKNKTKTAEEKLEEFREEVLAKGRKFKYPLQRAKYQIVGAAMMVAVVLFLVFFTMFYTALYQRQSTSDILFKITQFLPVSVAEVEGEKVRYGDYLLIYKSSINPVIRQGRATTSEMKELEKRYKRVALDKAIEYAYVAKIAREEKVVVTEGMIKEAKMMHRRVGGQERSEEGLMKVIKDNFGLNMKEYERLLYLSLLRKEVLKKIDVEVVEIAKEIMKALRANGGNMRLVANQMKEKVDYEETGGMVDDTNIDGGRAVKAIDLKEGEISEPFVEGNGEGLYIVKLVKKGNRKVDYQSIKIPMRALEMRMEEVKKTKKIVEKIRLE